MRWRPLLVGLLGLSVVGHGAGHALAEPRVPEVQSAFSRTLPRGRVLARTSPEPVVIVAIDGVRPREVFEGEDPARVHGRPPRSGRELMPNLYALADVGRLLGSDEAVVASGPAYVSLPGYTEMFTGAPSRCASNDCGRTRAPTLIDAAVLAGLRASVVTSWERICLAAAQDPDLLDASCGRHEGRLDSEGDALIEALLERDAGLSPLPGAADYRPDWATAELAIRVLEAKRPDVLFVGLGDTDELAHAGNYPAYVAALVRADAFLGALRATLAAEGARGRNTTVMVVTDHGRSYGFRDHGAAFPESRFGFLLVSGPRVPRGEGPGANVTLADVGRGAGRLLGVGGEDTPFTEWLTSR